MNRTKWKRLKAEWSAVKRYIDGLFYMGPGGNGDLFYNTARKIIETNNKSKWAHEALEEIFRWLRGGKRWPGYYAFKITTSNHEQDDMTQDPWILAYCCAVHLDRYDLIEKYKPDFWMFMPDKWAWRRALLEKTNLYWLWRKITPYNWMQWYVYVFYGFMEQALIESKKKYL